MSMAGKSSLMAKLAALPEKAKANARAALEQNADELVALQKRLAPRDSGALAESFHWKNGSHDLKITVLGGGSLTTREVRKGSGVSYDYAMGQEFGNERAPAQPSFFPAYRANKSRMKGRLTRAFKKGLQP